MSDRNQELKRAGLKVTLPRVKILEILQAPENQHISAEDVYKILIDQGEADEFLAEQLYPEAFAAACATAGQPLQLRRHAGYNHLYYFVATVIEDHLMHHAAQLRA